MLRGSRLFKIVSIIVLVILVHEQVGWTQEGRPVWADLRTSSEVTSRDLPLDINIPYDIGDVSEAVMNGSGEVIINIQDAHASLSSQYSIVDILDNLVSNYDVKFIALEGAEGFVDTSLLRTFPDKRIRKETAEFLMKEGRMSAGEFFDATRDENDIVLYGVEDDALYNRNVESFREIIDQRVAYSEEVTKLIAQLDALSEKVFSPEIRTLEERSRMHREGRMSFSDYWESVSVIADKRGVSRDGLPNVDKLLLAIAMEKGINFARANLERKQLIDALSGQMDRKDIEELVLKSLLFKQNKVSQADYHGYLSRLAGQYGLDTEDYGNLIAFTEYVTLYESIDIMALFGEIAELEGRMREALYRNGDERELHDWMKLVRLVGNLYNVELSNDDCAYIMSRKKDCNGARCAGFIKKACLKYGVTIEGGYDAGHIFTGVDEALGFYRVAESRNNALLMNTLKRMKAEGKRVAALITGGYHTRGLTELMRKNKLSYLVVVPKFEKGRERPYIAILTNKKKPYQELLGSGKYQLAVRAYFDGMNEDKFVEAAVYALSNVVKDGGDWRYEAERWFREYSREYEKRKKESEERIKGSLPPGEFAKILGVGDYAGQGQLRIETWEGTIMVARVKDGQVSYFRLDRGDGGVLESPRVLSPSQGRKILAALDHAKKEIEGTKPAGRVADLEEKMARLEQALREASEEGPDTLTERLMTDKDLLYRFVDRFVYMDEVKEEDVVKKLKADPAVALAENWQADEGLREAVAVFAESVIAVKTDVRGIIDKLMLNRELSEDIAMYFVSLNKEVTVEEVAVALRYNLRDDYLAEWQRIPALVDAITKFTGSVKRMYGPANAAKGRDKRWQIADKDRYTSTIHNLELAFDNIAYAGGKDFKEYIERFNGTEERPLRVLEVGSGLFCPIACYLKGSIRQDMNVQHGIGFSNIKVAALDPRQETDEALGLYRGNALKMDMFRDGEFDQIFAFQVFNNECYTQYSSLIEEFWEKNFPRETLSEEKYYRKIAKELFRITASGGEIHMNVGPGDPNLLFNRILREEGFRCEYADKNGTNWIFAKPFGEEMPLERRKELAQRAITRVAGFLDERLAVLEKYFAEIPREGKLDEKQVETAGMLLDICWDIVNSLRGDDLYIPQMKELQLLFGWGTPGHIYDIPGNMTSLTAYLQGIVHDKTRDIAPEIHSAMSEEVSNLKYILETLRRVRPEDIRFFRPEGYNNEYASIRNWRKDPPLHHSEWMAYLFANDGYDILKKVEYNKNAHEAFDRHILSVNVFGDMVRSGELGPASGEEEMFERVNGFLTETDPEKMEEAGNFARIKIAQRLSEERRTGITPFAEPSWKKTPLYAAVTSAVMSFASLLVFDANIAGATALAFAVLTGFYALGFWIWKDLVLGRVRSGKLQSAFYRRGENETVYAPDKVVRERVSILFDELSRTLTGGRASRRSRTLVGTHVDVAKGPADVILVDEDSPKEAKEALGADYAAFDKDKNTLYVLGTLARAPDWVLATVLTHETAHHFTKNELRANLFTARNFRKAMRIARSLPYTPEDYRIYSASRVLDVKVNALRKSRLAALLAERMKKEGYPITDDDAALIGRVFLAHAVGGELYPAVTLSILEDVNADLTDEEKELIRFRHSYAAFTNHILQAPEEGISIDTLARVNEFLPIVRLVDTFDDGQNKLKRGKLGKEPENFLEALNSLEETFSEEGITDRNALNIFRKMMSEEDRRILNIVAEARKSNDILVSDHVLMDTMTDKERVLKARGGLGKDRGENEYAVMTFRMGLPEDLRRRMKHYLESNGFDVVSVAETARRIGMDEVLRRWGVGGELKRALDQVEADGVNVLEGMINLVAEDGTGFEKWLRGIERENPGLESVRTLRFLVDALDRGVETVIVRSRVSRERLVEEFEAPAEAAKMKFQDFFRQFVVGNENAFKAKPGTLRAEFIEPELRPSGRLGDIYRMGEKLIPREKIGLANGIDCPGYSELPKDINKYLEVPFRAPVLSSGFAGGISGGLLIAAYVLFKGPVFRGISFISKAFLAGVVITLLAVYSPSRLQAQKAVADKGRDRTTSTDKGDKPGKKEVKGGEGDKEKAEERIRKAAAEQLTLRDRKKGKEVPAETMVKAGGLIDVVLDFTDADRAAEYREDVKFLLLMTMMVESDQFAARQQYGGGANRGLAQLGPRDAEEIRDYVDRRTERKIYKEAVEKAIGEGWEEATLEMPLEKILDLLRERVRDTGQREEMEKVIGIRGFRSFLVYSKFRVLIIKALGTDWGSVMAMTGQELGRKLAESDLLTVVMSRVNYFRDLSRVPDRRDLEAVYRYYLRNWKPEPVISFARFQDMAAVVTGSGVLEGLKAETPGSQREAESKKEEKKATPALETKDHDERLKEAREKSIPSRDRRKDKQAREDTLMTAGELIDVLLEYTDKDNTPEYRDDVKFLMLMTMMVESDQFAARTQYRGGPARGLAQFEPPTADYVRNYVERKSGQKKFVQAMERAIGENWESELFGMSGKEIQQRFLERITELTKEIDAARKAGDKEKVKEKSEEKANLENIPGVYGFKTFLRQYRFRILMIKTLGADWSAIVTMSGSELGRHLVTSDFFTILMTRANYARKQKLVPSRKNLEAVWQYYLDTWKPGKPVSLEKFLQLATIVDKSGVMEKEREEVKPAAGAPEEKREAPKEAEKPVAEEVKITEPPAPAAPLEEVMAAAEKPAKEVPVVEVRANILIRLLGIFGAILAVISGFLLGRWTKRSPLARLERFVGRAKPGKVLEIDLGEDLLQDREMMKVLAGSKNEISIGRVPNTYRYIFQKGEEDIAVGVFEKSLRREYSDYRFEGHSHSPARTHTEWNRINLPSYTDLMAEASGQWHYIISERGLTWFKADNELLEVFEEQYAAFIKEAETGDMAPKKIVTALKERFDVDVEFEEADFSAGLTRETAAAMPLKELIAPDMPLETYALNRGPVAEELLFFAAPMILAYLVLGMTSIWTLAFMAAVRSAFFMLHPKKRDIMTMSVMDIVSLINPSYGELRKHAYADWKFVQVFAKAMGIREDSEDMKMLRVISMVHDMGGVLGQKRDEDIEKELIVKTALSGIDYRGMDPNDVEAELMRKGVKLTGEERRFIANMDHPANSIRMLDKMGITVPFVVRRIVLRHMEAPSEEELKTWTEQERRLFTCFVIADVFETGNNYYKQAGGYYKHEGRFESPEETMAFIKSKRFDNRPSIKQYLGAAEKVLASESMKEAISFSRKPIAETEFTKEIMPRGPPASRIVPLAVAGMGAALSALPVVFPALAAAPVLFVSAATIYMTMFHFFGNILALIKGIMPATMGGEKDKDVPAAAPVPDEVTKALESLASDDVGAKLDAIRRLGDTKSPYAIAPLVKLLGSLNRGGSPADPELKVAIIEQLARLKGAPLKARDGVEIGSSIMGIINGSLDELSIPKESVNIYGPYEKMKIKFDLPSSPVAKIARLNSILRAKFADSHIAVNVTHSAHDTLELSFDLTVENLTAFWRALGTVDLKVDENGNYRKFTDVEMMKKVEERARMLLGGMEEGSDEYRNLHFFVYGDGTNANPGLLNIMSHPEKPRAISDEEYAQRYEMGTRERELVREIDGKKTVSYGDSQLIRVESMTARRTSVAYCSYNNLFALSMSNPYFTHYLENVSEEEYGDAGGIKRWVYFARAAGSVFQTSYMMDIMRGIESNDHMFFISQDTIAPYNRYGAVIDSFVSDIDRAEDTDFESLVKWALSDLDAKYTSGKERWREVLDAIWLQMENSYILNGVNPGEYIMTVDEIANGTYDFMLKYIVEKKTLERTLAEKGTTLEEETERIVSEEGLAREDAEEEARRRNRINVDMFIGKARTAVIPGYPELEIDRIMRDFGISRERADEIIESVSTVADFVPHPVKIRLDENSQPPFLGGDIPIQFEESDVLVASYLKALITINGLIDYHENVVFYPLANLLVNDKDPGVRKAAASALAKLDLPDKAKEALIKAAASETDPRVRSEAAISLIKILAEQLKGAIGVDKRGRIQVRNAKELLEKIDLVVEASDSPYAEAREFASGILAAMSPDMSAGVARKMNALPMDSARMVNAASEHGFVIPSVNIGLGKVTLLFQAQAVLQAARDTRAAVGLALSDDEFENFDYNNELSPVDQVASIAERVYEDEASAYFHHLESPKVGEYSPEEMKKVKEVITMAMEQGYTSISTDCSGLYLEGRILEKEEDWSGEYKEIGVFRNVSKRREGSDIVEEFEVWGKGRKITGEFEPVGKMVLRNGEIERIPATWQEGFRKYTAEDIMVDRDMPARERLRDVIRASADIYEHIQKESRRLGVKVGREATVGETDTGLSLLDEVTGETVKALTTPEEVTAFLNGVAGRVNARLRGEQEIDKPYDLVAINNGLRHGYRFDDNDVLIPQPADSIDLKLTSDVASASKTAVTQHGFSGTAYRPGREIPASGIGKININTDLQAIVWRVLEAYAPETFRKVFGLARQRAALAGEPYITNDPEYDYEHARNRIIYGYAKEVLTRAGRENDYTLINEIRDAIQNSKKRMLVVGNIAEGVSASYIVQEMKFIEASERGTNAATMIRTLTYRKMLQVLDDLGCAGSADKIDREGHGRLLGSQMADLLHKESVFSMIGTTDFIRGTNDVVAKLTEAHGRNADIGRPTVAVLLGAVSSGKRTMAQSIKRNLREYDTRTGKEHNVRYFWTESGWMTGYSRREDPSLFGRFDLKGSLGFRSFMRRIREGKDAYVPFFDGGSRRRFRMVDPSPYTAVNGNIDEERFTQAIRAGIGRLRDAGAEEIRVREAVLLRLFDEEGNWLIKDAGLRKELEDRVRAIEAHGGWEREIIRKNLFIDITERKNGRFISGDIVERIIPSGSDIFIISSRIAGSDEVFLPDERKELFDMAVGVWSPPEIRKLKLLKRLRSEALYTLTSENVTLASFEKKLTTEEMKWIDPTLRGSDMVLLNINDFEKFLFGGEVKTALPERLITELYVMLADRFNALDGQGLFASERKKLARIISSYGYMIDNELMTDERLLERVRKEILEAGIPGERPVVEPMMTIGIPAGTYGALGEDDIRALESISDVRIVILESLTREGMLDELEQARRRYGCITSVLVDVEADTEHLAVLIAAFAKEIKDKVFVLAHPKVKKPTPETISEIENLPSLLKDIADKYLDVLEPLGLATMSVYRMRVRDSYRSVQNEERRQYLPSALENREGHYLVHYADGNAVLDAAHGAVVPAGLEILRRREMMKVNRDTDRQHDRFMVMAPENVVTDAEKEEFRNKLMEMWMLEGVIDIEDVVILDHKEEGYTNGELFGTIRAALPAADVKNTGFRCIAGELGYDNDEILQVNLAPEANNNINQYEVFVNLLLTGEPGKIAGHAELKAERGKLYIYLPQARPIDFEEEVRNYYEKYREVLIRA